MSDEAKLNAPSESCSHYVVTFSVTSNTWVCNECGKGDLIVIEGPPVTSEELRRMIKDHR